MAAIEPVSESSVSTVVERSQEDRERWWKMGLKAIFDGKLAVLLLSGGQVYFNLFLMNIYIFFLMLGQPVRERRHVWLRSIWLKNKIYFSSKDYWQYGLEHAMLAKLKLDEMINKF